MSISCRVSERPVVGRVALSLLIAILTACGGGGGGGGDSAAPPVVIPPPSAGALAPVPAQPSNNNSFTTCPTAPAPGAGTPPANAGQPGVISGRITFDRIPFHPAATIGQYGPGLDYNNPQTLPARGVVVEAVRPSASAPTVCSGSVLDTAITDGDGWYALAVGDPAAGVCVRARAQLYREAAPSWNIAVADNTDSDRLYAMTDSNVAGAAAQPRRDLHAGTGWSGSSYSGARVAAPFAILDTACKALNAVLAVQPTAQFGNLNLYWSVRNTDADGAVSEGKIGGPFFTDTGPGLYLRGDAALNTDEFDEMVIAHEFGHFVTHRFSRSDSLGGPHSLFDYLDPRVAFDEGWATAFAGLVLGTPLYRDSDEISTINNPGREFFFDIRFRYSAFSGVPSGWFSETSVQRALYIAGSDVGSGGLGLGLNGLLQAFLTGGYATEPALASIFSFGHYLKLANPTQAVGISSLLNDETMNGDAIEPFAGTETRAPTGSDLPVYRALAPGSTRTVCSTSDYGVANKLSNRRYLTFQPASNARYRFRAQPGSAGAVAGLELLDRGRYLGYEEGTVAAPSRNLTSDVVLQVGRVYVLGVFHVGNGVENSAIAGGEKCFQVSVTAAP